MEHPTYTQLSDEIARELLRSYNIGTLVKCMVIVITTLGTEPNLYFAATGWRER